MRIAKSMWTWGNRGLLLRRALKMSSTKSTRPEAILEAAHGVKWSANMLCWIVNFVQLRLAGLHLRLAA